MNEPIKSRAELYGGIPQDEYIQILFVDCGYQTAAQRRGWIEKRFGAGRKYTDELTSAEKSQAIEALLQEKAG